MHHKALVVLSGGQDSTTCLFWAKQNYTEVHALTFDYSQRHSREIDAAITVAQMAGIGDRHEILRLGPILEGTSPLVSSEQLEQYEDADSMPDGIEKTFVPLRNLLFATLAANRAYVKEIGNLVMGVSQEDYGGYPDCRQGFFQTLSETLNRGAFTGEAGTRPPLNLITPLMYKSKAQTVHMAKNIPGCWTAMAYTHTSYDDGYPPTGKDHATLLRAKGFELAGLPDPLVVRAFHEGRMELPATENYDKARTEAALAK